MSGITALLTLSTPVSWLFQAGCETISAMLKGTVITIQSKAADFPEILQNIPDPPSQLHIISNNWPALLAQPRLAIVGSRKPTLYGKLVTTTLARELAQAEVVVVSGLAFGIDAIAHRAALEGNGLTIAVLAGGLDNIYPRQHQRLAQDIINKGGALMSEYTAGTPALPYQFIARNRLISGIAQAVLVTEAARKSGTLHTAAFALDQGREVLAVPGAITSAHSAGTNQLIQTGATPITSTTDVLQALGIQSNPVKTAPRATGDTPAEQAILDLLCAGQTEGASLLASSNLTPQHFNQALTMLEIAGKIRSLGADRWSL